MRILVAHNFYQKPGGEDEVFSDELRLLQARGHLATEFTVHNRDLEDLSHWSLARTSLWNDEIYNSIRAQIRRERPDVVHFHNTFPRMSIAGLCAARDEDVAIVQTLHNYRLICPAAILYRRHRVCENCVGRSFPWPAVLHRCYRGSAGASGVSAAVVAQRRRRELSTDLVDIYIVPSEFARRVFTGAGLSAAKLIVKPNFLFSDPGLGDGGGGYAAFVGRLDESKGVRTLLEAWRDLGRLIPLKIVGDGPLRHEVEAASRHIPGVDWLGQRSRNQVQQIMACAEVTVFPSLWYETFGRTIIESYAAGTPVLASAIGAATELVAPGKTGDLFSPGVPADLISKLRHLLTQPGLLRSMRPICRQTYLHAYSAEQNYPLLMQIYQSAIRRTSRRLRDKSARMTPTAPIHPGRAASPPFSF